MNTMFRTCLVVVGFLTTTLECRAQLILVGSTANVDATSPPSNIVDVNPLTGAATNPRNTGIFVIGGIATQPSTGLLFGLTTVVSMPLNSLIQIDPFSGNWSLIGPTGLPQIVEGDLAFNPIDGMLYGLQDGGGTATQRNFFSMNPNTGAATIISNFGSTGDYSSLAFDNNGNLFTIDSGGTGNSVLHTINPSNGMFLSSLTMNVNLKSGVGMTFHPTSGVAYVADGGGEAGPNMFYTLDTATGNLSLIGSTGIPGGISGLAFVSVPEPSSIVLVGSAVLLILRRLPARKRPVLKSLERTI